MKSEYHKEQVKKKNKNHAITLSNLIDKQFQADLSKIGVILCEGTSHSMDVFLYSMIFPECLVVPSGGWTDVISLLPFLKKYCRYPVVGLIDRDNRTKQATKELREKDVYCTRLPFIENILCCPEVLKVMCRLYHRDYEEVSKSVRIELTDALIERLSMLNPFNGKVPSGEDIDVISITIVSRNLVAQKNISFSNIMYSFRDKKIASAVGNAMEFGGKEAYYEALKKEMYLEFGPRLISIMGKYIPPIDFGAIETGGSLDEVDE